MSTMMSRAELRSYADAETLAHGAAEQILEEGIRAISSQGRFSLALAGGSTPRATYEMLTREPFVSRLDWSCTNVFWSDERCIPPDRSDSNYGMARKALLDHVPIPAGNVFRVRGEIEPQLAAEQYETTLREFFSSPSEKSESASCGDRFDLVLLGMGMDGHTASLFPGTPAVHEKERWVIAQYVAEVEAWRVTFTPPLINSATKVIFLVTGAEKARTMKEVLRGPSRPDALPAQIVRPVKGELLWLVDGAAAVHL